MAKMKITPDSLSVVKKTLTLGAPTGIVPTQDSTSYFRELSKSNFDKFKTLFDSKVNELKRFGAKDPEVAVLEDPQVKKYLDIAGFAAMARDRQANKGKEGFDKNGFPLAVPSAATMQSAKQKLTGKK